MWNLMSRYYLALRCNGRRCMRCSRRSNLFGNRDVETEWEGWCSVCNAEWRIHSLISSCRCCSQACSIAVPFFCGFGIPGDVVLEDWITSYLWVEPALIHRVTMRRHKRSVQILEWTSTRLDWYLADDSSEELALDEQPMLWSLRHEYIRGSLFWKSCFHVSESTSQTLLSAIHTYLVPGLSDVDLGYRSRPPEDTWHVYEWYGDYWLWDSSTGECFFVDEPPRTWRRFYWFSCYPRTASAVVLWWHNAEDGRWFFEPFVPGVLQNIFDRHFQIFAGQ